MNITENLANIKGYIEDIRGDSKSLAVKLEGLLVVAMEDYRNDLIDREDLFQIITDAEVVISNEAAIIQLTAARATKAAVNNILIEVAELIQKLI